MMKNLRNNKSMPNGVGVILQWKETNKMGKGSQINEMHGNELGKKQDHPKDPFDKYKWRD